MEEEERERPSPYFGDYPDGYYISAFPVEGAREAVGPPPWVRSGPRTPDEPYPLRMFAEDSCEFALWGPLGEPPPGIAWGEWDQLLEDVLPISADLRERLIEWARQNTLVRPDHSASELDWVGFHLSRQLAATLGELYSVEYFPTFAGPHLFDLRARAELEPLAGWRLHES